MPTAIEPLAPVATRAMRLVAQGQHLVPVGASVAAAVDARRADGRVEDALVDRVAQSAKRRRPMPGRWCRSRGANVRAAVDAAVEAARSAPRRAARPRPPAGVLPRAATPTMLMPESVAPPSSLHARAAVAAVEHDRSARRRGRRCCRCRPRSPFDVMPMPATRVLPRGIGGIEGETARSTANAVCPKAASSSRRLSRVTQTPPLTPPTYMMLGSIGCGQHGLDGAAGGAVGGRVDALDSVEQVRSPVPGPAG